MAPADPPKGTLIDMANNLTDTSKFLNLVLRHQPEVIGMQLDSEGWLPIDELIRNANRQGKQLTIELLHEVVASCEKKRLVNSLIAQARRLRQWQLEHLESIEPLRHPRHQ